VCTGKGTWGPRDRAATKGAEMSTRSLSKSQRTQPPRSRGVVAQPKKIENPTAGGAPTNPERVAGKHRRSLHSSRARIFSGRARLHRAFQGKSEESRLLFCFPVSDLAQKSIDNDLPNGSSSDNSLSPPVPQETSHHLPPTLTHPTPETHITSFLPNESRTMS